LAVQSLEMGTSDYITQQRQQQQQHSILYLISIICSYFNVTSPGH